MELRDAISQISVIRTQMAREERLRGLRAVPIGFSGLLALGAAAVQPTLVPDPIRQLGAYLALWLGVAAASAIAGTVEIVVRCRTSGSSLTRTTVLLAAGQFLPCLLAGAAATAVFAARLPEHAWLLPGLWQLFFGLAILSCGRLVPRPVWSVGLFYLGTGCWVLGLQEGALAPWSMGLPFGLGQIVTAVAIALTLERTDAKEPR